MGRIMAYTIVVILTVTPQPLVQANEVKKLDSGFDWSRIGLSDSDDRLISDQEQFLGKMREPLLGLAGKSQDEIEVLPTWEKLVDHNDDRLDYRVLDLGEAPSALREIADRLIKDGPLGKYVPVTSIDGYGVGVALDTAGGKYVLKIVVTERESGLELPMPTRRRYHKSSTGIE